MMKVPSAVIIAVLLLALPGAHGIYSGPCLENCCCKVCSAPTNPAFPYGIPAVDMSTNPPNPTVKDATCGFPVWSDGSWDKLNGDPATPPSTLWWTDIEVFGDLQPRAAPTTCDCCRLSVDTSCAEVGSPFTRPKEFVVTGGRPIEYQTNDIVFHKGIGVSTGDYIELRNDTFCGYTRPMPVTRSSASELSVAVDPTNVEMGIVTWSIPRLPSDGCYRVCYFHSNLTTPTWYDLGTVTVYGAYNPSTAISFQLDPLDIAVEDNEVEMTFKGLKLLSVFDDAVEIRNDDFCGTGSEVMSTESGTDGFLAVTDNHKWCEPEVVQGITSLRPLRYIERKYSDCAAANRLYQERVRWKLNLPNNAGVDRTYVVCYKRDPTWNLFWPPLDKIGEITVTGKRSTRDALLDLRTATNAGNTWTRETNWGPSPADPCQFYGVRCDANSNVVSVILSRNNLEGTLPPTFFTSDFYNTIEYLSLDENHISGEIPREIGAFRNLKYLNLGVNQLTGTLPPTLQKTSLLHLYTPMNDLDGTVPDSLAEMRHLWSEYNIQMQDWVPTVKKAFCPYDPLECSEKGSSDNGVFPCGYAGITEPECVARGCCFNVQAALFFGGQACFTKRSAFIETNPVCTDSIECQTQVAPVQ